MKKENRKNNKKTKLKLIKINYLHILETSQLASERKVCKQVSS